MTNILPLAMMNETAIEALLDEAFGLDRHGRTAYSIRAGMHWLPDLSYACVEEDGTMLGLLQSWPVALAGENGEATPLVMVGPVAVLPAHQGDGHGKALMDVLMKAARTAATPPLVMIGDPEYYGRFWGFSAQHTGGWRVPGPVDPKRLLAVSLQGEMLPVSGMLGPRVEHKAA